MAEDAASRKRKQRAKSARRENERIRNKRKRILKEKLTSQKRNRVIEDANPLTPSMDCSPSESHGRTLTDALPIQGPINETYVREAALRNVTQFRGPPVLNDAISKAVASEMNDVYKDIRLDMTRHTEAVDPRYYVICCCCGHQLHQNHCILPSEITRKSWLEILESRIYNDCSVSSGVSVTPDKLRFCRSCANSLRRRKPPRGALIHGWPFKQEPPSELSSLSEHERLLICLRLPCVYVWRAQGGFGQYACRGSPVSFSNPVSDLATKLPRIPSKIFHIMLENCRQVDIECTKVRKALVWLADNNPLYRDVEIDESAMNDIEVVQNKCTEDCRSNDGTSSVVASRFEDEALQDCSTLKPLTSNSKDDTVVSRLQEEELSRGTQGPIDDEALDQLSKSVLTGVEDIDNMKHAQILIEHMLRPFSHRRNQLLPCYDAESHLESYFPVLFPYGTGGPNTVQCQLGTWVKHALAVNGSRFAKDVNFIFFLFSVLKRKRLTGLASHAPIRQVSSSALIEIRDLLATSTADHVVANRIDKLLRSGTLNASFETLRGSAAFWAALKRKSWAYLTAFGGCQLFITVSAADLMDPYISLQIDPKMSMEDARMLTSRQRANLLARNPAAATTIFHRRIQSILDNFLFGKTKPFGSVAAYLGRIEQQARHSPHLHLLIWLDEKGPAFSGKSLCPHKVADFIELFCTALLPNEDLTPQAEVPVPIRCPTLPIYTPLSSSSRWSSGALPSCERYELLSRPINVDALNGSRTSNRELRNQILSTQTHTCNLWYMYTTRTVYTTPLAKS